jgi:hypothetical protein
VCVGLRSLLCERVVGSPINADAGRLVSRVDRAVRWDLVLFTDRRNPPIRPWLAGLCASSLCIQLFRDLMVR